ncbi:ABC transporter substrate-binding protein [Salarchaeum sp. III]|uniref:ABC transporter substrate-binding protein n=1 Tax=Salarchaeum sp. III TaxID=3107927 RepID=UPI002EDB9898
MTDTNDTRHYAPTRRDYVKYGGALATGGLLAGCADDDATTAGETTAEPTDGTDTTTAADSSYSVTMAPVGEVEFDAVPERVLPYYPISAGATIALGHGDAITGIGYDKQLFGNTVDYYYDALDGVSFEWEELGRVTPSGEPGTLDTELFYELDNDVHFLDPCLLRSSSFGWSEADIEAIATDVGPWFGNYYSRTNASPPACEGDYEYYGLWEYIGKLAEVLRERERYEALKSVRDDLAATIEDRLPPAEERPSLAIVAYSGGTFWPYDFTQDGYLWNHVRPFGATNAFTTTEGGPGSDGAYDYEGMVEAEPDVVLRYWGTALGDTFIEGREAVLNDPLAEEVPAFRDGRYYPSGHGMQGPVMNLFQLEMTAKQLYPDQFGAWPGYGDGKRYPSVPEDERLFDRERVTNVITGDFE